MDRLVSNRPAARESRSPTTGRASVWPAAMKLTWAARPGPGDGGYFTSIVRLTSMPPLETKPSMWRLSVPLKPGSEV